MSAVALRRNNHGGVLLILGRVINFCWFCFKWGLLLGVIGVAVAVPYFYRRVDEKVRCRVLKQLAEHYVNLKVTVRAAELVLSEDIDGVEAIKRHVSAVPYRSVRRSLKNPQSAR